MATKKKAPRKAAKSGPPARVTGGGAVVVVPASASPEKRKKGRRGKRASRGIFSGIDGWDVAVAALTAVGYGMLQASVSEEDDKDKRGTFANMFAEAPVLTPLGRAGTYAAAGAATMYVAPSTRRYLRGVTIGLTVVASLGIGRRKLELYDDEALKDASMGGVADELAMGEARGGGASDAHGTVEVDIM